VHAHDAWLRPTAPGATSAALYVRIDNDGATTDVLVDGSAAPCMVLSVHVTTTDASGVAVMGDASPHATDIAPGGHLDLRPEGMHLMCYGLTEALLSGDSFDVTLHFLEAGSVVVRAVVDDR
jgi:periplasmic copper chaperone A